MTYKISMEMSADQIEQLIDQLPAREKIALSKRLIETNAKRTVRGILKHIDSRPGKRPSVKEIVQEIRRYRKENNAKSGR